MPLAPRPRGPSPPSAFRPPLWLGTGKVVSRHSALDRVSRGSPPGPAPAIYCWSCRLLTFFRNWSGNLTLIVQLRGGHGWGGAAIADKPPATCGPKDAPEGLGVAPVPSAPEQRAVDDGNIADTTTAASARGDSGRRSISRELGAVTGEGRWSTPCLSPSRQRLPRRRPLAPAACENIRSTYVLFVFFLFLRWF